MAKEKPKSQLERISSEVHDAWVEWTKHIQRRVKPVWRERWKKLFVDYDELPEFEKDKDRKFARRIQKVIKKSDAVASHRFATFAELEAIGRRLKRSDDYKGVNPSFARSLGHQLGLSKQVPLIQFREGIGMEHKEHGPSGGPATNVTGGSKRTAGQIALAHLREDPHYYTKLERMEGKSDPVKSSFAFEAGRQAGLRHGV